MNAKRIAKRIVADKPHWVTAAARRVLAGEDFDAVMQDLAVRHALHSESAFRSVERELRARVERERGAKQANRTGQTDPGNAVGSWPGGWLNGEWKCPKCQTMIGRNLKDESPIMLVRQHKCADGRSPWA